MEDPLLSLDPLYQLLGCILLRKPLVYNWGTTCRLPSPPLTPPAGPTQGRASSHQPCYPMSSCSSPYFWIKDPLNILILRSERCHELTSKSTNLVDGMVEDTLTKGLLDSVFEKHKTEMLGKTSNNRSVCFNYDIQTPNWIDLESHNTV